MHDLALVDALAFHLFRNTCTNGEVYNLIVRGSDHGALDGVDIIGTNFYVHDVMVTNKDDYATIESLFRTCSLSKSTAIGLMTALPGRSTPGLRSQMLCIRRSILSTATRQ